MNTLITRIEALQQIRFVRYLVAAGTATLTDVGVYWLMVNFIFVNQTTVSFFIGFGCGLLVNFLISKYYVFQESNLQTSTQGFRFFIVAALVLLANLTLNEYLLNQIPKFLALETKALTFIARFVSAASIAVVSFVSHKLFSFKV